MAHPSGSLAATSAAARDLAANLACLLNLFDALRRADFGEPVEPRPPWWDECVSPSTWRKRDEASRRAAARLDRIKFIRERIEEVVRLVEERWQQCAASIPGTDDDARLFQACRDSLRNLCGILCSLQLGDRLEYGVIPDKRHLERALPLAWNEESVSDEECQLERDRDEVAYRVVMASARSPKSKAVVLARTQLRRLEKTLRALRQQREARNRQGIGEARRNGMVSAEQLELVQRQRASWGDEIERWQLREQDVRRLLDHLTSAQHSRGSGGRPGAADDRATSPEPAADSQAAGRAFGGKSSVGAAETRRKPGGWTKKELLDETDGLLSATGFDRIRAAAGVKPSEKGGRGAQRRYSNDELRRLIKTLETGRVRKRKELVSAWLNLLPGERTANHH